ncbi:hypothetical protein [Streptomyces racemochromogenes]|uniref:hypothetical protein n=1 Tax=Streptomyces racemochromogenes TaxID=67353 RepID=UPI0035EBB0DD
MSATAFGVVLGVGTLGAAAGALAAPAVARRCGPGPMMLGALALPPLMQVPLLLASPGAGREVAIGAALFLQLACAGAAGTTQRSIRQLVTESRMQARMQAVSTCLTSGARPVGALLAGGLGTWAGVRPALLASACLLVVPCVVLARSPLRALRHMPGAAPAAGEAIESVEAVEPVALGRRGPIAAAGSAAPVRAFTEPAAGCPSPEPGTASPAATPSPSSADADPRHDSARAAAREQHTFHQPREVEEQHRGTPRP